MIFQTTHNNRTITVDAEYELVEDIDGKQLNLIFNGAWGTFYKKVKKKKSKYGKTKWRFIEVEKDIATKDIILSDDDESSLRDEFEEIENEKQLYNDPYKFYGLSKSDFL